ncbi:MAG TPA: SCO family protein [Polyangiaceae bacterium]|nr:SCO family protein [Polyangiaceae bacterium]
MKFRRLVIALGIALSGAACQRATPSPPGALEPANVRPAGAVGAEAPKTSLYDLPLALTDQDGRGIGLDVFRGHPVVISMIYTRCGYACPTLISDIKRLERSLASKVRDDLRVLLVSIDPERDTPERLKAVAVERKLDERRWRLTRAEGEQVRELAAVLGLKYRKLENGEFNHSSVIALLDRTGVVTERVEGLSQPLDVLEDRVRAVFATR